MTKFASNRLTMQVNANINYSKISLRVLMKLFTLVLVMTTMFSFSACTNTKPISTPQISVQLHSLRDAIADDFKSTITAIAAMGFSGVEFAGKYGEFSSDPKGLKLFLDELGLQVSGVHISLSQLTGEKGEYNIEFFKALGANIIIIPHDKRINNPAEIDDLIKELNTLTERLAIHDLQLGFHNHAKEFQSFQDGTFWNHLAQNTPQDFVLQLDVGWALFAGQNPNKLVKQYPNRTITTHIKRRTYQGKPGTVSENTPVILGSDGFDWANYITNTTTHGGTQWLVIEQEEYPSGFTPLEAVEASFKGLKQALSR